MSIGPDPEAIAEHKLECVAPPGRQCNGDGGIFCMCVMGREVTAGYRKARAAKPESNYLDRTVAAQAGEKQSAEKMAIPEKYFEQRRQFTEKDPRKQYTDELGRLAADRLNRNISRMLDDLPIVSRNWGKTRLQALELTGVDIMATSYTTDQMRRKSRVMSADELKRIDKIKKVANKLYNLMEEAEEEVRPGFYGCEFDNAYQRLEEAVMWATKGISG